MKGFPKTQWFSASDTTVSDKFMSANDFALALEFGACSEVSSTMTLGA